ncbi:microviridin/marinostatin family tricyclic proteinase inhibitor [Nostoc sp. UHCC 0251]|uniref:microviridin/marinostatin family tricyclic proteinase inhibitor n=1 Tax=Nostoc sp. UHCC 0251 TaxID=3110240 RepID=UPI002B214681|nr:microviridin/marinostatin family tricyclic proteinase inhibitor [Nostoc sp. UHCC 0251]MEA5627147.1 microviridin/marinostatin family tricyclic proteinase inhibitor [Nostoc sp. UHCC 0251]
MSENKPEELNSQAVPFFARFLEGQSFEDLSDQESEEIGGGHIAVTKKYPSDNEEGGRGTFVTQKFPSDNEDGGGGKVVTLKFPSDNEDGIVETRKYPSDSDEVCR